MNTMNTILSGYAVGALLYCPANAHPSLVSALVSGRIPTPFSLAFCLEDTVRAEAVPQAEAILSDTLRRLREAASRASFYLPRIFIRVRSPQQLQRLSRNYRNDTDLVTGFLLPKFSPETCGAYLQVVEDTPDFWYLPILESPDLLDLSARADRLCFLREQLNPISSRILNIRVGGNDLCHAFGVRRHVNETIYDIRPVANLLSDIVTTFAPQYVVSGPVWEYYAGFGWDTGLRRELELDLLNGFVGKTVIHPNQIPVVNAGLRVLPSDYSDARQILSWDTAAEQLVFAGSDAVRMNEVNTHTRWAKRILCLAEQYGVREDVQ